jgi:uncharacterized phage protein (TIGR02218 family)
MRTVSAGLQAHHALDTLTLATLWRVTRRDGQVFGFTDLDRDIEFNGVTYHGDTGISGSAAATAAGLQSDNLEVQGFLQGGAFTAADLAGGVWDGATVRVSVVNYADLSQGELIVRVGELGQVRVEGETFVAEARGLADKLNRSITRAYLPVCDADLGDARCKVNLAPLTVAGTVTSVASRELFTASGVVNAAGYFTFGVITWVTGANAGLQMEVKTHAGGGVFTLQLPMRSAIAVGDTFNVVPGCDKTTGAGGCAKFSNIVNFRGFPHVPGLDKMTRPGGV